MNRAGHGLRVLAVAAAFAPLLAIGEPDEARLGKDRGYPVGGAVSWYSVPYRVGSWSAMDEVKGLPTRAVKHGGFVSSLPPAAQTPAIRWRYRNIGYTLDDYLERQRITGLLIIKNGEVLVERYRYGRSRDSRFLSFSMAKSVTSMLVGIALEKGAIKSLQDPAEKYAKELAGSPYGGTSIEHLLRMSSGLTFTERYDGNDDIARLSRAAGTGEPSVVSILKSMTARHSPAGQKFVYASAETEVLGRVLAGATGRHVADLTSE